MGGSALTVPTERISAQRYFELSPVFVRALEGFLGPSSVRMVPAYASKPDFGDLDLVVDQGALAAAGGVPALTAWAQQSFHARSFFRNAPSQARPRGTPRSSSSVLTGPAGSLSFDIRDSSSAVQAFQADLNFVPADRMDVAVLRRAYNDLGHMIGCMARHAGFSLSDNGLRHSVLADKNVVGRVLVSADPDVILDFLGFDVNRYAQGFETMEDIFGFVAQSRFFHPDVFIGGAANAKERKRIETRPTYRGLLQWLADRPTLGSDPHQGGSFGDYQGATRSDPKAFRGARRAWLLRAGLLVPGFAQERQEVLDRHARDSRLKERFDGTLVQRLTGRSGPELGRLMAVLRKTWPDREAMATWMADRTANDVAEWIIQEHHRLAGTAVEPSGADPSPKPPRLLP